MEDFLLPEGKSKAYALQVAYSNEMHFLQAYPIFFSACIFDACSVQ